MLEDCGWSVAGLELGAEQQLEVGSVSAVVSLAAPLSLTDASGRGAVVGEAGWQSWLHV